MNAEEQLKKSMSGHKLSDDARERIVVGVLEKAPIAPAARSGRAQAGTAWRIAFTSVLALFMGAVLWGMMGMLSREDESAEFKESYIVTPVAFEDTIHMSESKVDHVADSHKADDVNLSAVGSKDSDSELTSDKPYENVKKDPVVPAATNAPKRPEIMEAEQLSKAMYDELCDVCEDASHTYRVISYVNDGAAETVVMEDCTTGDYFLIYYASESGIRIFEKLTK